MFSFLLELYATLSLGCTAYGAFGPKGKVRDTAKELGFNVGAAVALWRKAKQGALS